MVNPISFFSMAFVVQDVTHAEQSVPHFEELMVGNPLNLSGRTGGAFGYFAVRYPCAILVRITLNISQMSG
jgi:hypothetical protein